MELFPRKYSMIVEVTRLEELLPPYSNIMRKIGFIIRNKVLCISNEDKLALYLHVCNNLFEVMASATENKLFIADFYIKLLKKQSRFFTANSINHYFMEIEEEIEHEQIKGMYYDLWRKANPYYMDEYGDDERYKKDIVELIDEILDACEKNNIDSLFIKEGDLKFLCRGRYKAWDNAEAINAPSIEVAIKKNTINRWNPPDRRYIYLVVGDDERTEKDADRVCMAELRANKGATITLVNFRVQEASKNKKLLMLNYEDVSFSDIRNEKDKKMNEIIKTDVDILNNQYPFDISELNDRITSLTLSQKEDITNIASVTLAKIFFKYLCDVIFVPLDKDEDEDKSKKEKCYKAFHVLALYLEQKGIAGIIYPSTRMKKRNEKGTNVVIFNAKDVAPIEESLRVVENLEDLT